MRRRIINKARKLEQNENYAVGALIYSSVHTNGHEGKTGVEPDFHIPVKCAPNHSRGKTN